jgi:hypothetical protein
MEYYSRGIHETSREEVVGRAREGVLAELKGLDMRRLRRTGLGCGGRE